MRSVSLKLKDYFQKNVSVFRTQDSFRLKTLDLMTNFRGFPVFFKMSSTLKSTLKKSTEPILKNLYVLESH